MNTLPSGLVNTVAVETLPTPSSLVAEIDTL